ncbi:DUF4274 domain-containing protein [Microbacterium indicum]|uniref:DUF4274 domain-containing protein n=1 Tax=Microbacterium indicum TaxID=358100 RepID=UPI0004195822|nr:DUF4274 domain-containing protein [Microbacterium indicum]
MRDDVAEIIENDDPRSAHVTALVAALPDEGALWELMSSYNWDDGFAVPLAVVSHPRCDRALALRMFWELDDTAQLHLDDEDTAIREVYAGEAERDPEGFRTILAYCTTLVGRLRDRAFPVGANRFDTGFFGLDDPALTDRQHTLRAAHTKRAQRTLGDAFLEPVL